MFINVYVSHLHSYSDSTIKFVKNKRLILKLTILLEINLLNIN